jgi:hypothetical protein
MFQKIAGPREVGFGSTLADIEHLADLPVRITLNGIKVKNHPVLRAQLLDHLKQVFLSQFLQYVFILIMVVLDDGCILNEHDAALFPDALQSCINNDLTHPPLQGALIPVLLELIKDLDEPFLQDILGIILILGISHTNTIQPGGKHFIEPTLRP